MTGSAWPNSLAISSRSKGYSGNKAVHLVNQTKQSDHVRCAAEVAATVGTDALVLDCLRWNVNPVAVVYLARDPVTVLEFRFRRRTVLVVAAR
jgi:hypothetical protein